MLNFIWLIPLLPLSGVLVNLFFGGRMGRRGVNVLGAGVVLLAFLLSVGAVWELSQLPAEARHFDTQIATWMPLGEVAGKTMTVNWGFALDALSSVLLLVVSGVGFLIHLYSTGYMSHEKDYRRFFLYLNLFMTMMLTLVLADNLLVLFVGWEGVGLCSYLLIGFFYDKPFDARTGLSCSDAGRKAFIVNRIGDFAFLIGMLYLAIQFGTLRFSELNAALAHAEGSGTMLTAVGVLLFIGACGKSAQIPLFVWLPDAMAGPTPVSALIHAATMVTAGVYMVCRMSALYAHTPDAMLLIATVGAATALFAATMGITATDIKKVLAYSTVSQLGFMFAAAGVGAYSAAMFHLMTHAFFKALLFLGAGSVIHGLSGEQDIRKMGGLRSKMPTTFWTFCAATLAISGIFPLAGFFSKDEILAGAWNGGNKLVWGLLLVAAICTAFYMARLTYLVFFGQFRGDKESWSHAHESPRSMTLPLSVLGVLSIAGGWIGIPELMSGEGNNFFHHWLEPAITPAGGHGAEAAHHASAGVEWGLIILTMTASLIAIFVAQRIYKSSDAAERNAKRFGPIYTLLRNLYWVDEFYELIVLRPFYGFCRFFRGFDRWIVDGLVNLSGIVAEVMGQLIKLFQTGFVRNYALMVLFGVVIIVSYLITGS